MLVEKELHLPLFQHPPLPSLSLSLASIAPSSPHLSLSLPQLSLSLCQADLANVKALRALADGTVNDLLAQGKKDKDEIATLKRCVHGAAQRSAA